MSHFIDYEWEEEMYEAKDLIEEIETNIIEVYLHKLLWK